MDQTTPPRYQEDEQFIDLGALIRYLAKSWTFIFAFAAIPIALYLLFAVMQAKSYQDNLVASIVKINQDLDNFNPNAIISEQIVSKALEDNSIESEISDILPLLNVVVGFERINDPIDDALAKLSGEVSVSRGENLAEIEARYASLVASQNHFLTIYFNLEDSPVDATTAKIIVSEVIRIFNERFEQGLIRNMPLLSEIKMTDLEGLDEVTSYNLGQSLRQKVVALKEEGFDKRGFNPEVLTSRINYIDLQLSGIISTSAELQRFFIRDIDREINIATDHINSLEAALDAITEKKSGLGISTGSASRGQGGVATEYNSELFERFLNVGASLSLVEFQESLLNQKLELEFRRTELRQQKKSFSDSNISPDNVEQHYAGLLAETRGVATDLNSFIRDFNASFQKQILSLVNQNRVQSASLFQLKPLLLTVVASFGIAIAIGVFRFSARQ